MAPATSARAQGIRRMLPFTRAAGHAAHPFWL